MRISVTTGIVVLTCLMGGIAAGLAIWMQYERVMTRQSSAELLALAERDYRQLKTLTNQWFVAIDLFFDGTQSYAANSIARQSNELKDVVESVSETSDDSPTQSAAQIDRIANIISGLAITGPNHPSWNEGLLEVDELGLSIVEELELATDANRVRLESARIALEGAQVRLTQVTTLAGVAYLLFVLLGWSWANRKVVVPLQRLQRSTRNEEGVINAKLHRAPLEISELAATLNSYSEKVVRRQRTIEQQNQQLEDQLDEIKRTRNKLIKAEKLASVGQLAAGVAHEINNPMAFVSTNLSSLEKTCQDIVECLTQQKAYLATLADVDVQNADQLRAVRSLWESMDIEYCIEDVKDIFSDCKEGTSRITGIVGQLSEFTDVTQVPASCSLGEAVRLAVQEDVARFEIVADQDPQVWCPEPRLQQAVRALCQNALDATIEQRSCIRIELDKDESFGWVTVKDEGCGIDPDIQAKIFDPFFSNKDVGEGIGLSLHFVQATAEQADGEVTVVSTPGEGSEFTLRLPLTDESVVHQVIGDKVA